MHFQSTIEFHNKHSRGTVVVYLIHLAEGRQVRPPRSINLQHIVEPIVRADLNLGQYAGDGRQIAQRWPQGGLHAKLRQFYKRGSFQRGCPLQPSLEHLKDDFGLEQDIRFDSLGR